MPEIIGVKFAGNGKSYYFDPQGEAFEVGDGVIVETVRGVEYGTVSIANTDVAESEIKGTLKKAIRKATPEDDLRAKENTELAEKAMDICAAKIAKHGLKMKLVGAEYTFDRAKVIFSFTADGRVDFRELVKDVASVMHTRIELRQIYERDDIRMRGAMGMCGRPCCCIGFLGDYEKVTVKMTKNQNLSLNPTKVSGMCGKLMCCLKYENDYYAETLRLLPKQGATVRTADGVGRVDDVDVLRRRVRVAIENDDGVTKTYYGIGEFEPLGAPPQKQQRRSKEEEEAEAELEKLEDKD